MTLIGKRAENSNANFLSLGDVIALVGHGIGCFDVACPQCGPARRGLINRKRKVLRIWRNEFDFATFHCARCGIKGFARADGVTPRIGLRELARLRTEAAVRDQHYAERQRQKARVLYRMARGGPGTPAETYLRARGIDTPLPNTVRFLAALRPEWYPAMLVPFGIPDEPEPGVLAIGNNGFSGIHLTLLKPDGSGKADVNPQKITVGPSMGAPLVLAPVNDGLGLAIAEGIEDALSAHEATGLGAWAAGCASRLPALADQIPRSVESVTLLVDDDSDGRRHAATLRQKLQARGIEVRPVVFRLGAAG